MAVIVRVPTILRNYTGGEAEVSVEGETLRDVLTNLEAKFTGIGPRILDENGKIRRFVNVYVNEEDVRFENGLDTSTADGSIVSVLAAVAGG